VNITSEIVSIVSKVSPALGTLLGGPIGGVVGTLMSNALGVDMEKPEYLKEKLQDPNFLEELKTFEAQLSDIQDARQKAASEIGAIRYFRPFLVLLAFAALFIDVLLIMYVENDMIEQILLVFMGMLVFDIKQIYRFYFGSGEEVSAILPNVFKKSKRT